MPELVDSDSTSESSNESSGGDSDDDSHRPAPHRARHNRTLCDSDLSDEPASEPTPMPMPSTTHDTPYRATRDEQAAVEPVHTIQGNRMWEIAHVVEILARWHVLDVPDEEEDPVCVNGWAGSCFDAAPPKPGHARFSHLNARTFGVTGVKGSRDAQTSMWKVQKRLHVSCACYSDTGLVDPTLTDPMSSLKKSHTLAKFAWEQRNCTFTHGQGSEGTLRPAVGGTLVATDDALSRILGVEVTDPRGWGRFTGRILVGKEGTTTVVLTVYFPCTSDKSCPGSA
jgi:hypothetical protein